ncbi:hypothetical protein Q1695_005365 [Nippostrongylus brasiliensis]|nr:hypothetical protein Q1695_005365 [Nippostrongylus brasiliensis]
MIMHAIVLAYLLPTVLPQDKDYSVDSHTISCGFSCTKTAQFDIKLTSQDDPVTVICSGHNDTQSCKECCTLMAFVEEIDVNRATGLSPANGFKTIDMHVIAFIFLVPIVLAQHEMDDYDEPDHIPCGLHCFINTTVKAYVTNANELGRIHCTGPLQRCTPCCIMKATAHGLTHDMAHGTVTDKGCVCCFKREEGC